MKFLTFLCLPCFYSTLTLNSPTMNSEPEHASNQSPTSHLSSNAPPNSPIVTTTVSPNSSPDQMNKPNPHLMCLVIPIWISPSHLRDTNNNPPTDNNTFFLLSNLYETYLHYPTSSTSANLCWLNLMRGLLNNATWTTTWANLMHNVLSNSLSNNQSRHTLQNLQLRNIPMTPLPRTFYQTHMHNLFPNPHLPYASEPNSEGCATASQYPTFACTKEEQSWTFTKQWAS